MIMMKGMKRRNGVRETDAMSRLETTLDRVVRVGAEAVREVLVITELGNIGTVLSKWAINISHYYLLTRSFTPHVFEGSLLQPFA